MLNKEYVKRYGGKLILRIEDTDPRRVDPERLPNDGGRSKVVGCGMAGKICTEQQDGNIL